ncbi:hypothetical protein M8C21_025137 [Ambrosia artemisiifolia]|uniref:RRM domain-containing protein n=1 Tax=Ambrosia artemisiifolia TaxID=4212 RepID=A0AAD5GAA3_AMBAR|nr:hypothetical protein M8C21_025137 [Ambrosia artemisiifolia]
MPSVLVIGLLWLMVGSDSMEKEVEKSFSGQRESYPASTVFQEVENAYRGSTDISLFSSSLPGILHEKYGFPLEDESEDITTSLTGSMLPGEEDELFTGTDDFDLGDLPTQLEDLDLEDDLFESGGGMEMDSDSRDGIRFSLSNLRLSSSVPLTGINRHELPNSGAPVVGEHPYGEHPSRTLFVRNINSNVEDSELRSLFEEYGEIRNLYTACKHRGFVMISYYDIRHARAAMRELQNKPLRRRKLDIHFSIPKDNPSEKDINQGTLVVFNLDASISSDDLRHIFAVYGEVKEIRETPNKRHHKFVEFYDVRAAEMALKDLNGREIAGKRIKLEHSRPGGTRRSLMQQLSLALEQDETRPFWHHAGSPVVNSPPGSWTHLSSPREHGSPQGFSWSSGLGTLSPVHTPLPGLASILPSHISNPVKIAPIGKDPFFKSTLGFDPQQSHSFPNHKTSTSAGNTTSFNNPNFDPSSIGRLSGPEFLWGSPTTFSDHQSASSWRASSVYASPSQHGSFLSQHHHVGSAPSAERTVFNGAGPFISNGSGSPISRMTFFPNNGPIIMGNGSYQGRGSLNEGLIERSHSRRVDYSANQMGNKQYQLDLEKIITIDETNKGTYDFVYLPIDFKNKCNVGYAFINMVSPSHIISFYEAFNGKKWEKFNSEKVASLAYARIQGKVALITHFQNSSLMNEDKWCRPIIFQSEAQEIDNQDSIPYHNMNICIRQPDGSYSVDSLDGSSSSPEKN